MTETKVRLDVFEGPLDLLLYLVKKEEVDIYEVNLTKIATQFIEYIDMMRQLDLDIAGEFLVMASTLMYIKSRELLPVDQQTVVEAEDDDANDPRWELIRQLVEYKKFKDVAGRLHERELIQENIFRRLPAKLEFAAPPGRPEVSLFDLINAVSTILKRFGERSETRDVFEDKWTVSEKIEYLAEILQARTTVKFSELFATSTSRLEVVVTFLALLELIRLKHLRVSQPEPFGEIEISLPAELVPVAAPEPVASLPAEDEPSPLTTEGEARTSG
ncbi:MAG: segregation/condensation protein A [Verrucomicrobiales bacterium]|nr:segregation/condensation protein A [Verrucomicrobiales bacterium]